LCDGLARWNRKRFRGRDESPVARPGGVVVRRWTSRLWTTTADAHGEEAATTTARFSGAQRSSEAVADVRQGMAAVWRTDSSVLDSDVAAATVQRMSPAVKSEDGATTHLAKDIAEGSNKKIHDEVLRRAEFLGAIVLTFGWLRPQGLPLFLDSVEIQTGERAVRADNVLKVNCDLDE